MDLAKHKFSYWTKRYKTPIKKMQVKREFWFEFCNFAVKFHAYCFTFFLNPKFKLFNLKLNTLNVKLQFFHSWSY